MESPLLTIVLASIGWTIILTTVMVATFWAISNRFDTVNSRIDSRFDSLRRDIEALRDLVL